MLEPTNINLEEFRAQLRAQGFDPEEKSLREMYAALPHLNALRARLRRRYVHSDEPAHVFKTGEKTS
ncbi:hypothetical protein [Ruegeria arenilitoris]|uniref:hypothetical protein n=1 Tax=Ruegeria arenilitoris TaxID=1173585 RepID=UPI00147ECB40|nr:hypothetical protein [Ruegeria arenilitoris]